MKLEKVKEHLESLIDSKQLYLFKTFVVRVTRYDTDEFDVFSVHLFYPNTENTRKPKFSLYEIKKQFFDLLIEYTEVKGNDIKRNMQRANELLKKKPVIILNDQEEPICEEEDTQHSNEEQIKILENFTHQKPARQTMSDKDEKEKSDTIVPVTINNLRTVLLQNIADLRNGKIPLDQAKEIANQTQTVINLTKLELQYLQMKNGGKGKVDRVVFLDNDLKALES